MYPLQLALLGAEALLMATLVLALFRSRTVVGLSPLYIVVGGFQYLEASLNLRVDIAPGWAVYPASMVMFTATLLAVLLVYIKEDTREARKLVYGLMLANAGLSLVSMVVSQHLLMSGAEVSREITIATLRGNAWVAFVGTVLLPIDVIGIILVYEFVSGYVSSLFLRACAAMLVIVAVDNFFFTLAVQWGNPDLPMLMASGLAGKTAAALFYSALLAMYLRFVDPVAAPVGTGDVADVFQKLTYRQLYEQAWTRATRDALTGLHNRGYFDEALPRAVAQAARYQHPLSVLLVDTDHFKEINDTHGHMVGDRVLKLVAELLAEHARAADTVCRYGGDEFVVILSSADAISAAAFAERFRRRLRDRAEVALSSGTVAITATVGVATFLEDAAVRTAEDLLQLADHRLYQGKRAGRNRVVWRDAAVTP
jgi:diguanylate cyclase (GGDEF)-like protein